MSLSQLLLLAWYGTILLLSLGWGVVLVVAAIPWATERVLREGQPTTLYKIPLGPAAWSVVWGLVTLVGLGLLAFSLQTLDTQKSLVDSLAADGSAEQYSRVLAERSKLPVMLLGISVLAVAIVAWLGRGWLLPYTSRLLHQTRRGIGLWIRDLRQLLMDVAGVRADGWYLFWLVALLILGVILRFAFLNQPMRYDEAFTYLEYASRGLKYSITSYTLPNNHILHTVLVAITTGLLGDTPYAIRLPAFLAGSASVPISYLAARSMYNKQTALLTAGLVAASSGLIEYSTNARGYSLVCLFTLTLVGLAAYVRKQPNIAAWLLLATIAALGLYTVPTMLFPVGAIALWLALLWLLREPKYPSRPGFQSYFIVACIAMVLLTAMLYLPVLAVSDVGRIAGRSTMTAVGLDQVVSDFNRLVADTWSFWSRDLPLIPTALLLLGLLAYFLFRRNFEDTRVPLAVAVLIWSVALTVVMRRVTLKSGVWLFLLPLVFMWASAGLTYLWHKFPIKSLGRKDLLIAVVIMLISLWFGGRVLKSGSVLASTETGTLPSAEEIAYYLEEAVQPGDTVAALFPSDALIRYYTRRHGAPENHLYQQGQPFPFKRALVVVNTTTSQSFQEVIDKLGISSKVDLASARPIKTFDTAVLIEVLALPPVSAEEGRKNP